MSDFPSASLLDVAQLNRLVAVPNALQGLFRRRRRPVAVATGLDVDGAALRFLAGLRRRHDGRPVWVRLGTDRALLLLSVDDVRRVLEGSPDPFASDPPAKRKGMGVFQPHALTLSRGEVWAKRRRFTEQVLDTPAPVHRLGERFVAVAREEAQAMRDGAYPRLTWDDWHPMFRRLMRRVVLGDRAADDEEVTDLLAELMSEANGLPGGRSERFGPFVEKLRSYVEDPEPDSLVSLFADAHPDPETAATGQVPHWMFATADTLAINSLRALALIASHPDQRAAVDRELGEAAPTAEGVAGLRYLRACLHEGMRLWPTTPLLARETVRATELDGGSVPEGTQVAFSNLLFHRDRDRVAYADSFAPEAWTEGDAGRDWAFNHFSHGPQGCPGVNLALLLAGAVLMELLTTTSVALESPQLDPARPLPAMLDFYAVRFRLGPGPQSAASSRSQ
jgi:cytochrome P450